MNQISDNISLSRNQLDKILSTYCDVIGISYSTMHDEAFCVQGENGWIYLWYDNDHNILSHFVKEIEDLYTSGELNIIHKKY